MWRKSQHGVEVLVGFLPKSKGSSFPFTLPTKELVSWLIEKKLVCGT